MTEETKLQQQPATQEPREDFVKNQIALKRGTRVLSEEMSENIGELAVALSKAQGAMSNGKKDKQGYGYTYMTLGNLTDIARRHLAANGLAVIQSHELIKGASPAIVTHTTIFHKSNQWHKSSLELPITPMKQLSAAQCAGIACTYGRRYSLQALLLIASEEDTDGK